MNSTSRANDTHRAILKGLKRAEGRLKRALALIDSQAPCHSVAHNLSVAERAVGTAKARFVSAHLRLCLENAVGPLEHKNLVATAEFDKVAKYL